MAEIKVVTQKIENKNHDLLGEVRGDADVNMHNLNFQVNIYDLEKAKNNKGDLKGIIKDFYYNYFKPSLKGTEWEFMVLEPLSMTGVDNKTIKIGEEFNNTEGIKAISAIDGDITKEIKIKGEVDVNKVDSYNLEYSISDTVGNSMTVIRTITVRTNTPPVIKGIEPLTIKVGDIFDPRKGVTAEDKEDGDLTKEIKVKGIVNTELAGTYNVTYEVIDKDNNLISNIRVITVENRQLVQIKTEEGNKENLPIQ